MHVPAMSGAGQGSRCSDDKPAEIKKKLGQNLITMSFTISHSTDINPTHQDENGDITLYKVVL